MSDAPITTGADDPLLRPVYGIKNKVRRAAWGIVCFCFFRPSPRTAHAWRSFLLRLFGAKIGKSNRIYASVTIWAPWLLETGDVVLVGPGAELYNPGGIRLAHHTIISQGAYLIGATHDYNAYTFETIAKPIISEPYAWVCARAIVLPGVKLGEGSVLGAGAVTSKSLEPWTVYAGNPATKVAPRNKFDINGPGPTNITA